MFVDVIEVDGDLVSTRGTKGAVLRRDVSVHGTDVRRLRGRLRCLAVAVTLRKAPEDSHVDEPPIDLSPSPHAIDRRAARSRGGALRDRPLLARRGPGGDVTVHGI